jgi:hypothetical protein
VKKLWLKSDPAVTAEVIRELNGAVAAEVHNPRFADTEHPDQYLGFIHLDEWSDVEVVPVPICASPKLWVAVIGKQDPADVTYVTFDNEVALHVAIATRSDILGFFEVAVPSSMIPARIEP